MAMMFASDRIDGAKDRIKQWLQINTHVKRGNAIYGYEQIEHSSSRNISEIYSTCKILVNDIVS